MDVLPPIDLVRPTSIAEAVRARLGHPDAPYLAGGTDLIANLRHGLGQPSALIDIAGIPELREIRTDGDGVSIGAAVTLHEVEQNPSLRRDFPILPHAAAAVAGPAHRVVATVGGNLCLDTRCVFYNQSTWWRQSNRFCRKYKGDTCHVAPTGERCHAAFSGDLAPALLVLGAEVDIAGRGGMRRIPLAELYRDEGQFYLRLGEDELLTAIHVPPARGLKSDYAKARTRGAIDFPLAGVAIALDRQGDTLAALKVGLTGTNSRPFLLEGTAALIGRPLDQAVLQQLDKLVQKQVSPMRTTIAPAHYRRRVAAALACRLAARLYAATSAR
jgi:4-hydroxybenzoyl-CoA reductase subunit beta